MKIVGGYSSWQVAPGLYRVHRRTFSGLFVELVGVAPTLDGAERIRKELSGSRSKATTPKKRAKVLDMRHNGASMKSIAAELKMCERTVKGICYRTTKEVKT